MTNPTGAQLIALDWGTTSCRAYLLGDGGVVLAEMREPSGIMEVTARASVAGTPLEVVYEQTFMGLCGEWLARQPRLPVIACGMVGSNKGWAETEYRPVPTDLAAPAELTPVLTRDGVTVHIIPGVNLNSSSLPDAMRGEETQILGILTKDTRGGLLDNHPDCIVLLPGTHSKWVRMTGTTIIDFTTYMTGEFYALLTKGSILSRLLIRADQSDWEAFDRGLEVAASPSGRGGILTTAFSARTLVITCELAPNQVEDYLSGLLIGHELAGIFSSWLDDPPATIILCGDPDLNERYRRAIERLGVPVTIAIANSAPFGMWNVARATGLV
jgi:2-dehydro-3-deoxygalactonokinase